MIPSHYENQYVFSGGRVFWVIVGYCVVDGKKKKSSRVVFVMYTKRSTEPQAVKKLHPAKDELFEELFVYGIFPRLLPNSLFTVMDSASTDEACK